MTRHIPGFVFGVLVALAGTVFAAPPAKVVRVRAAASVEERFVGFSIVPDTEQPTGYRLVATVESGEPDAPVTRDGWEFPLPGACAAALDTLAVQALAEAKKKRP